MRIHKASLAWQGVKAGIQLLPGGFIASVMVFYVILYLAGFEATEGETDTFLFALVTGGLFSLMFWRGCVNLALLLKLRRYNKAVELLAPKSLEELSRGVLESPEKVQKALARMIHLHLISVVPYDIGTDFTVPAAPAEPQAAPAPEETAEEAREIDPDFSQAPEEKVTVTCPHCRGVSIITKGTQAPCDYCKKIIQG